MKNEAAGQLKHQAARASLWTTVTTACDQSLSFAIFAIVTHYLEPGEFGVFSLSFLLFEFGRILTSSGLPEAVMRSGRGERDFANAAFTATVLGVWAICILLGLLAFLGLSVMGLREYLLPVIATLMILPVRSLGAIHTVVLLRDFGHRANALRALLANTAGCVLAVWLAMHGHGVWSLIAQRAVTEAMSTTLVWIASGWVPRLDFRFSILRPVAGFSGGILSWQLITLAIHRMQEPIVGLLMGAHAAGLYRAAWRMPDLLAQFTVQPLSTVSTPVFSALQGDRPRMATAYLKLVATAAMVALPAYFGFGALADLMLPLLLGAQWSAAAPLAVVFSLMALPGVISWFVGPVLTITGRPRLLVVVSGTQLGLALVLSLAAAPFGLLWMAVAHAARAWLVLPLQLQVVRRALGVSAWQVCVAVGPYLLASMLMVSVILWSKQSLLDRTGSMLVAALIEIVLGAVVYAAALWLLARRAVMERVRYVVGQAAGAVNPGA